MKIKTIIMTTIITCIYQRYTYIAMHSQPSETTKLRFLTDYSEYDSPYQFNPNPAFMNNILSLSTIRLTKK